MPSIIGNVKIISVGGAAIVNFGDSVKSTSKTFAGAGSFNTGDFPQTNNGFSATNTYDPDIADANAVSSL
jgi:spore germination protein PA